MPRSGNGVGAKWRNLFLGTMSVSLQLKISSARGSLGLRPNVLALNFASTLVQSLIFLVVFMAIAAILLYHFYCSTSRTRGSNAIEGLQQHDTQSRWGVVIVTFLLTVIYLPLSTMAVHVLVWSQDLWVVPNPYINSTVFPPVVAPLGPADQFRDPLDFCWTTTMKRNDVNYAPIFVIIALLIFVSVSY